jgi:hypothetical protein
MFVDLTHAKFNDDVAACTRLEQVRWGNDPFCPHCGTVGTVMERGHIPLNKWALVVHLLTASKKGMSSHQFSRMLPVTNKTA